LQNENLLQTNFFEVHGGGRWDLLRGRDRDPDRGVEVEPAAARGAANLPQPHAYGYAPKQKKKNVSSQPRAPPESQTITKPPTDKTPTPLFF
jgi:hypothetical protein